MPTPGYVFRDGGATPPPTSPSDMSEHTPTNGKEPEPAQGENQKLESLSATTESHALAMADQEEKGSAQRNHDAAEVKDVGWNASKPKTVSNLVGGLPNDELWTLVRRFNKQMYHVKALPEAPLGGLDLYIADEDEFSPDKLRANIERLYMTVIIGLIGFGKHIARLRSWREPGRTGGFCAVYFLAWLLDFLVPTFLTTLIVLIIYPPARPILFPPAPLALVNSKTGGVQKPQAGVLGSHDSVTGAPEKHQGEAVEQEASNFVSGIAHVAVSSAAGKHEQNAPEGGDPLDSSIPDPTNIASTAADAKDSAGGGIPTAEHDKTKKPMEEAIWTKMRPIMHVIGDIADGWERFANALSPTPPFPMKKPRLTLAGLLVPVVLVSIFITSEMLMKGTTFGVGAGFFGDPLMRRGLEWLNRNYPDWQKLLELRNTILKGVPTNAQLTITLLRIGEANRAPLPPPPTSDKPAPEQAAELDKNRLSLDASDKEINDAIHPDDNASDSIEPPPKKKAGSKILGFLKGTTKSGVETKLTVDHFRAKIGSEHAKNHLGILPNPKKKPLEGPIVFKARYKGRKGAVRITTSTSTPLVSFSTDRSENLVNSGVTDGEVKEQSIFSLPVRDIAELKKVAGLGWKAKLVVGWAMDATVADGLEIVDKSGQTWKVLAMRERDELFNRLVAMGGQAWESW